MEIKSVTRQWRRWSHAHTFASGALFGLVLFLVAGLGLSWGFVRARAFLPQTQIAGLDVSWLDGESAAFLLAQRIGSSDKQFRLEFEEAEWLVKADDLGLEYDLPATINQAWLIGRQGSLWERLSQVQQTLNGQTNLGLVVKLNETKLTALVEEIATKLDEPAIEPALKLEGRSKKLTLEPGKDGLTLAQERLLSDIKRKLAYLNSEPLKIELEVKKVALNQQQADEAKKLGEKLLDKKLTIQAPETDDWTLTGEDLITLLAWDTQTPGFDQEELKKLVVDYANAVNHRPQNAAFQFVEGKVEEFRPSKDGLKVLETKLIADISQNFERLERESVTMDAPVELTPPEITTESVNNLGIKERLGMGDSTYLHSIPNRIYNVDLTASRLNGVIVAPGETFSFNEAIGDISAATGYRQAYVIKEGRTVLGDGGGVCQVSTTLFRAILNAGLPIVERQAHAYRVGYYEQNSPPGIDATVYGPTVDLKFKNDTPAHLLIQTSNNPKTQELVIEIYGTQDGRQVEMTEPKIWGYSPAPPALYQDDPSLPTGQTKQIDWAASGAKTSFDYKVTRDGEVLFEKTFYSNYRPWQAIYLRGPQI